MRTRLPRPKVLPEMLDVKAFITRGYCVYVFSTVVNFFGLYTRTPTVLHLSIDY
jgi:hypothetical protein